MLLTTIGLEHDPVEALVDIFFDMFVMIMRINFPH